MPKKKTPTSKGKTNKKKAPASKKKIRDLGSIKDVKGGVVDPNVRGRY